MVLRDGVDKLYYLILECENATLLIWLSFIRRMLQKRNKVLLFMLLVILFSPWIGCHFSRLGRKRVSVESLNRVRVQEPSRHIPIHGNSREYPLPRGLRCEVWVFRVFATWTLERANGQMKSTGTWWVTDQQMQRLAWRKWTQKGWPHGWGEL